MDMQINGAWEQKLADLKQSAQNFGIDVDIETRLRYLTRRRKRSLFIFFLY
jgi:hypothetical protein